MKVSHDGPPEPASGRKWIPRILRTTSLPLSTPYAIATFLAIRLQPHVTLRRFISRTASISSLVGPLRPGRRARLGENSRRYFCFVSILWKCSRVDGFKATADRKTRSGRISSVHKPTIISEARRLGARFRPRFRIKIWCRIKTDSATTERSPPGRRSRMTVDDGMQKKSENVAHAPDGIRVK